MRKIEFERLDVVPEKNPYMPVKVTTMGNVTEIIYDEHPNTKQNIQMLDGGEQYVILSTGEIKDVVHHDTRKDNINGLYKTFAHIRAVINTNVTDVLKVRWITLTYAENMTDTKRLYMDFQQFNQRFQYHCKINGYGKAEYIVVMEPQERGAWHAHLFYIWEHKAPYIANSVLAELWGHGFVTIKKLNDCDNIGAYLTAYLGDMELSGNISPYIMDKINSGCYKVKTIECDEDGKKVSKYYLKGARLDLYPANFNMYRTSRGIKKPTIEVMSQAEAEKKVLGATKTFERATKLTDIENGFEKTIIKTQYNKACKKNQ